MCHFENFNVLFSAKKQTRQTIENLCVSCILKHMKRRCLNILIINKVTQKWQELIKPHLKNGAAGKGATTSGYSGCQSLSRHQETLLRMLLTMKFPPQIHTEDRASLSDPRLRQDAVKKAVVLSEGGGVIEGENVDMETSRVKLDRKR